MTTKRIVDGGVTSYDNGQGLCEECNYVKSLPGWDARAGTDESGRHTVTLTTPTGAAYDSAAPRHSAGVLPIRLGEMSSSPRSDASSAPPPEPSAAERSLHRGVLLG